MQYWAEYMSGQYFEDIIKNLGRVLCNFILLKYVILQQNYLFSEKDTRIQIWAQIHGTVYHVIMRLYPARTRGTLTRSVKQ